jgi:hypothetical protein
MKGSASLMRKMVTVLRSVRAAKDDAKGIAWSRLHRIESIAATVAGTKAARRDKPAKRRAPAAAKTKKG